MLDFLFSLPLWVLVIMLNVWLVGFALATLWALRRWVFPKLGAETDASLFFGAAVMQSAMVLYGLIAALTAVSVWTRHAQVSDIVSSEATSIATLWRDLGGYPDRGWPEDYDLLLRLWEAGHRMAKVPEPLFLWREQPERTSRTEPAYAE